MAAGVAREAALVSLLLLSLLSGSVSGVSLQRDARPQTRARPAGTPVELGRDLTIRVIPGEVNRVLGQVLSCKSGGKLVAESSSSGVTFVCRYTHGDPASAVDPVVAERVVSEATRAHVFDLPAPRYLDPPSRAQPLQTEASSTRSKLPPFSPDDTGVAEPPLPPSSRADPLAADTKRPSQTDPSATIHTFAGMAASSFRPPRALRPSVEAYDEGELKPGWRRELTGRAGSSRTEGGPALHVEPRAPSKRGLGRSATALPRPSRETPSPPKDSRLLDALAQLRTELGQAAREQQMFDVAEQIARVEQQAAREDSQKVSTSLRGATAAVDRARAAADRLVFQKAVEWARAAAAANASRAAAQERSRIVAQWEAKLSAAGNDTATRQPTVNRTASAESAQRAQLQSKVDAQRAAETQAKRAADVRDAAAVAARRKFDDATLARLAAIAAQKPLQDKVAIDLSARNASARTQAAEAVSQEQGELEKAVTALKRALQSCRTEFQQAGALREQARRVLWRLGRGSNASDDATTAVITKAKAATAACTASAARGEAAVARAQSLVHVASVSGIASLIDTSNAAQTIAEQLATEAAGLLASAQLLEDAAERLYERERARKQDATQAQQQHRADEQKQSASLLLASGFAPDAPESRESPSSIRLGTLCILQGHVRRKDGLSRGLVGTVRPECRPPVPVVLTAASSNGALHQLRLDPNGQLRLLGLAGSGDAPKWLSLSGQVYAVAGAAERDELRLAANRWRTWLPVNIALGRRAEQSSTSCLSSQKFCLVAGGAVDGSLAVTQAAAAVGGARPYAAVTAESGDDFPWWRVHLGTAFVTGVVVYNGWWDAPASLSLLPPFDVILYDKDRVVLAQRRFNDTSRVYRWPDIDLGGVSTVEVSHRGIKRDALILPEVQVFGATERQENEVDYNIALHRPTYQSSTALSRSSPFSEFEAQHAVDGSATGASSETLPETAPWWSVDIGEGAVRRVVVHSGFSSDSTRRLDPFEMALLDAHGKVLSQEQFRFKSQRYEWLNVSAAGVRSVLVRSLSSSSRSVLALAEVEVFGTRTRQDANIARGGSARQSSVMDCRDASKALDGNACHQHRAQFSDCAPSVNSESVAHSNLEASPWWQVDFDTSQEIDRVWLHNYAAHCCLDRLVPFNVTVFDDVGKVLASKRFANVSRTYSWNGVGARNARSVKLQLEKKNYLAVSEVAVFGRPVVAHATSKAPAAVRVGSLCVLQGAASPVDGVTSGVPREVARVPAACAPRDGKVLLRARSVSGSAASVECDTNGVVTADLATSALNGASSVSFDGLVMWRGGASGTQDHVTKEKRRAAAQEPDEAEEELNGETQDASGLIDLEGEFKPAGGGYRAPSWLKASHAVFLSGVVQAPGGQSHIATLPRALWPRRALTFSVAGSGGAVHELTLLATGSLQWTGGNTAEARRTAPSRISLDGVAYWISAD